MKLKISVVILFVFTLYIGANAQVSLLENFDYMTGDTIGAHGWTSFSGGPNNPITVVAPGFSFPGYSQSGIGNAARMSNYGQDYYKQFTGDSITSGSVYVSFMINVDSVKTGDYFTALLPASSTTLYTSRFYVKDTSGIGILFGISKGAASGGPIVYTSSVYQLHTTYLIVFKYKFNTGSTTDDEMSFYVFNTSIPGTEPPTPTVGPVTGTVTDATNFGRLGLRQGSSSSSPTVVIDGIMITNSWSSLVNVIRPISTVADKFSLSQNYPNPFNPATTINFSVPSNGTAKLNVYNALGQQVQSLLNGSINAGTYSVQFNGKNLNSGLYFYKLELTSNDGKYFSDIKKLMLVK